MPAIYSHSRLSCFENCPRQFQYRYVRKLPARWESIEAFVGKRVHEVLERLVQFVDAGKLPSLAAVLKRYRQMFDDAYDAERVRIVREGTAVDAYRDAGAHCLSNHYRHQYPFDAEETLSLEQRVTCDLNGDGRYRLQGFVDRVARARDGTVEIHDYKTGRRMPTQKQLDADRQLALYQLALRDSHPRAPGFRLVWHFLRAGRVRVSTRTPEQLDALRADIAALIDRVESEQAYPAKPSALCGWCEYRDLCDASPHYDPSVPEPLPLAARAKSGVADPGQLPLFGSASRSDSAAV